jgi:hypothetical protein
MRRLAISVLAALLLVGLVAAPAAADPPRWFTDSEVIPDFTNPCTGLEQTLNLTIEGYRHDSHDKNQNNFIYKVVVTGFATDEETGVENGWVIERGREHFMWNDIHRVVATFHHIWRNDEGSKYTVNGVWLFNADTGEEERWDVRSKCLSK